MAAAAAVGPDGSVYVATSEGKVHGIAADGRHRFTHNIVGAVLGAPGVGADGIVKVGNVLGMLHALRPSGRHHWGYRVRSAVTSDVSVGPRGLAYFATANGQLLAVTRRGGTAARAKVREPVSAGPVVSEDAAVLVGTTTGRLLRFRGAKREWAAELDAPVIELALASEHRVYALGGETLFAVDRGGKVRWQVGPVESAAVAPGRRDVAGMWNGVLQWWSADGVADRSLRVGVSAVEALGIDRAGCVYVPTATGELLVVEPGGRISGVRVGSGPLNRPMLDPERGRVVAVSGDGQLLVIEDCQNRG